MLLKNSLRVSFVALLLGVLAAGSALAADTIQAGGVGGTGSAANGSSGMGGTGAPALTGGIGGTGAPEARGGIGGTGGLALSAGIGGTGAPAGKYCSLPVMSKLKTGGSPGYLPRKIPFGRAIR
jgi:hypothetical protein